MDVGELFDRQRITDIVTEEYKSYVAMAAERSLRGDDGLHQIPSAVRE